MLEDVNDLSHMVQVRLLAIFKTSTALLSLLTITKEGMTHILRHMFTFPFPMSTNFGVSSFETIQQNTELLPILKIYVESITPTCVTGRYLKNVYHIVPW